MKKMLVLIAAMAAPVLVCAQQIEMSKAECTKWQKAFVLYGTLEEACGYRGQVSEMAGKISAAGNCQSRLSAKEVNANTAQVLRDLRRDVQQQGVEALCTYSSSNYYELQKQYEESGLR